MEYKSLLKARWPLWMLLLLNVILLYTVVQQGRSIDALDQHLSEVQGNLSAQIRAVPDQITQVSREASSMIREVSCETSGIDMESHSLLADLSVSLKSWQPDGTLTLLVTLDGQTEQVPVEPPADGTLTVPLRLSPDGGALELDLMAVRDGVAVRESLCGYDDVRQLLPFSIMPVWTGGNAGWKNDRLSFSIQDSDILFDYNGIKPESLRSPTLRIYRNDTLSDTFPCTSRKNGTADHADTEAIATPDTAWANSVLTPVYDRSGPYSIACGRGDRVALVFACQDQYGLTYEYRLQGWVVDNSGTLHDWENDSTAYPTLIWPE